VTSAGTGSMTAALRRSLFAGLTLLWLVGVVGSGVVLQRLIDQKSDDELQESCAILLSLASQTDDVIVTAALLGEHIPPPPPGAARERLVYQVRDASGKPLLRSANAPAELLAAPLREGLSDVGDWRVATRADPERKRFLQIADPLSERREALLGALLWLTLPLAALLGFAAYIVFRASRSLVIQVERTAAAVSRQDPQALGLLSLDGVVTEMRPAVEATNRLLRKLADALETERSFTYNSAHELRTPISAALAQSQLLASMAAGSELEGAANRLVTALSRLARLAERLLALARAEGAAPLADAWVDLASAVRLTTDEFAGDPRLAGRRLVVDARPARVRGDLDAVGLALRNLVENAMVHGAAGRVVRVSSYTAAEGVVLSVADDGVGVPANDLPRLTRRFVRAGAKADLGAGLGLAIVEMLARRMGANVTLASPPRGAAAGFEARIVWPTSRAK
jgi:two-component system OmpR family sensor kinase